MSKAPCILCVDADIEVLEAIRKALGPCCELYLARGPVQGLEKLELGPEYAAILAPKKLGALDGVDFLSYAAVEHPQAKLVLTGREEEWGEVLDSMTLVADTFQNDRIDHLLQLPCAEEKLAKVISGIIAPGKTPVARTSDKSNALDFGSLKEWLRYGPMLAAAA